jgi:hypothetical protein
MGIAIMLAKSRGGKEERVELGQMREARRAGDETLENNELSGSTELMYCTSKQMPWVEKLILRS